MAKTEIPCNPIPSDDFITIPRVALQALAEWAYPLFAFERITAKLPTRSKSNFWNIHDDLHTELERERMTFLKDIFWKAYNEAGDRERAIDPSRGYGGNPSLNIFMECLAGMENPHWDEPMASKEVAKRKKAIKAKKAEEARVKKEFEHPTPERIVRTMTQLADTSLFIIKENLVNKDPEIKSKAQAEVPRLMAELNKLQPTA